MNKPANTNPNSVNTNNPQNTPQKNEQEKKKKDVVKLIMLGVIIILILLLLVKCSTGGFFGPDGPSINIGGVTDPSRPDFDPNQGDYVKPDAPVAGGVAIPGWGKLTIPVNTSKDIVVDFYNPEANAGKYYLTFELRIPADNEQGYEVLYKSGMIEAGKHIQKIDLTRGLPEGTYNAILHVQPYRASDMGMTNNADLKMELVVK